MSKKYNKSKDNRREQSDSGRKSLFFSKANEKLNKIGKGLSWLRKNIFTKTVNICLLIIIVIAISIYVRMGPSSLSITDQWAESTILNNVQNNIGTQIRQQRPDLPEASINQMVQTEVNTFYETNKDEIDSQVQILSMQFKEELQNDDGFTHLLGIDEYLWYSYAKWYDTNGYFGTELVDGKPRFMLRGGRFGQEYYFVYPSYMIDLFHGLLKIFDHNRTVEQSAFYISIILMALTCIPAFFLGRKISGNVGGFFAATIIAVSSTIVGRTLVGAPESDGYTVLFPLLITWLFFEALSAKNLAKTIILSIITGISTALFYFFWGGWWFTFLLLMGMTGAYIVYMAILRRINNEKIFNKELIRQVLIPIIVFISMILFAILISLATTKTSTSIGPLVKDIASVPLKPINFITGFKSAADEYTVGGDNYALWPNVLRTVAELNPASIKSVINSPGVLNLGKLAIPVFWLGVIGIILMFLRYNESPKYPFYGAFLLVWLISTVYAGTTGIRFMVFTDIVIAFGIGSLVSFVVGPGLKNIARNIEENKKSILKWTFIIILFFALLWAPIKSARAVGDNSIPIFDDAWYESMKPIANSTNKAIITSWWDYGHFFQAFTNQTVTFDGGDQGKRIYWVGKTLVTPDEDEALDILKMMNCGQEEGYNLLEKYLNDKMLATQLILKITRETKEDARNTMLEAGLTDSQADSVLKMTHCSDLYDMYFITSEDMVGKATVWGYFGSWDFEKAFFYYHLKNLPLPEAIDYAKKYFGYDSNKTREMYNYAKKISSEDEAALWISYYPGYITQSAVPCSKDSAKNVVTCNYNLILNQQAGVNVVLTKGVINLTDEKNSLFVLQASDQNTGAVIQQSTLIPSAIVLDKDGSLERVSLESSSLGYDVVLYKNEGLYYSLITHEALSRSLFTKLFYMNGQYTEHFQKVSDITSFRGERIIVWKINP